MRSSERIEALEAGMREMEKRMAAAEKKLEGLKRIREEDAETKAAPGAESETAIGKITGRKARKQ